MAVRHATTSAHTPAVQRAPPPGCMVSRRATTLTVRMPTTCARSSLAQSLGCRRCRPPRETRLFLWALLPSPSPQPLLHLPLVPEVVLAHQRQKASEHHHHSQAKRLKTNSFFTVVKQPSTASFSFPLGLRTHCMLMPRHHCPCCTTSSATCPLEAQALPQPLRPVYHLQLGRRRHQLIASTPSPPPRCQLLWVSHPAHCRLCWYACVHRRRHEQTQGAVSITKEHNHNKHTV